MGKYRAQHYIPQFYLKKYLDKTVVPPYEPYLWVHTPDDQPKAKAPKNVAHGNGYYNVRTDDGEVSQELEHAFSLFEGEAGKILHNITINNKSITIHEKALLSEFIYYMHTRVPNFRENVNRFTSDISKMIMQVASAHPEYLHGVLKEVDRLNGEENDHDIDGLIEFIQSDRYTIEVPQERSIQLMIDLAEKISEVIFNMRWEFLIAPSGVYFVTSDNPVVLLNPKNTSNFFGDGFRSSPSVEMTFPLSPKCCLLGTWPKGKERYKLVTSERVRAINLRTCNSSSKHVYSCTKVLQLPRQ
ncbi:DUF4238 domain-containing protein [Paenibacillus macquariensis]|uniref:DUF4238 domain-containing protein n=1 Tax=Paenibacillus macquariensis TaxID=948756 RepID=A0ABY1JWB8_9BACL|nr:DUF4238 domain-containing protein [Paenibacillus macquariensis]MEC0094349.1 DUF4238 domain-containing protein [Paenibacillus macquariensis]OAB34384.1 hypothetical protein PMSM_10915 [Paenibacillus macquariensis subsp. macquariensis]SIQ87814.1 Protein of unknown function [Paenibacillus macquariensis]